MSPVKLPKHEGEDGQEEHGVKDLNAREIAVLTPLAVGCLVLGLFPTTILRTLDAPLTPW